MKILPYRRIRCWFLLVLLATAAWTRAQESPVTVRVELLNAQHPNKEPDPSSVVVWLEPVVGATAVTCEANSSHAHRLRLVQKDKSFHPHLLVVEVGAWVDFPNHDPFFHNVFSLFEGKRFDLGLYETGTSHMVHFDRPGVSYIFCNIHPEMSAVVLAVNSPFFATSNAKGDVAIPGVPAGRYLLRVWHEYATADVLKNLSHEVTISEDNRSIGLIRVTEVNALHLPHKDKYGLDYVRPSPSSPVYSHP